MKPRLGLFVVFAGVSSLTLLQPSGRAFAAWPGDGAPVATSSRLEFPEDALADGAGGVFVVFLDDTDIRVKRLDASGNSAWFTSTAVCNATGAQTAPRLCSDGAGGIIVCWKDARTDAGDIYAQRVNGFGVVQWTVNGVIICDAANTQTENVIISDGAGGAIIAWSDGRTVANSDDIFAQRVNASGVTQWTADGVQLTAAAGEQRTPAMIFLLGGAIVVWDDRRSGTADIYGRRLGMSGSLSWNANGTAICTAAGSQTVPKMINDASTGAIITWQDARGASNDIYAQRVNSAGTSQWTADGVSICAAIGSQVSPLLIADGGGGAVVAWADARVVSYQPYVQRVNSSGVAQWASDGVALCGTGSDSQITLAGDGASGAIVAWMDYRAGGSFATAYARRVDSGGTALWQADGTALTTFPTTGGGNLIVSVSDAAAGAIVSWADGRTGITAADVYAGRVLANGNLADFDPAITAVADIPADQGGWVRIGVAGAAADAGPAAPEVTGYNVWRLIPAGPGPAEIEGAAEGPADLLARSMAERVILRPAQAAHAGFPPGSWESMGFHAGFQLASYQLAAPTRDDFIGGASTDETYVVTVHTTVPSLTGVSNAVSGYSQDNLAPGMPQNLTGQKIADNTVKLDWSTNLEGDLANYAVYRGPDASFVPGPANRIGTPTSPTLTDNGFNLSYYKVSAIDVHLNESLFAVLAPTQIVGVPPGTPPRVTFLRPAVPNPMRDHGVFAIGLSEAGPARLRIFDAEGRWVRTLLEGMRPAGEYRAPWDARDARGHRVPPGVYLARLDVVRVTRVQRVAVLE